MRGQVRQAWELPWWSSPQESALQCGGRRFDPCSGNWAHALQQLAHVPPTCRPHRWDSLRAGTAARAEGAKACRASSQHPSKSRGVWVKQARGRGVRRVRGGEVSTRQLWRQRVRFISPVGDSASSLKEGEGRPGMLARAPVAQVSSGLKVYSYNCCTAHVPLFPSRSMQDTWQYSQLPWCNKLYGPSLSLLFISLSPVTTSKKRCMGHGDRKTLDFSLCLPVKKVTFGVKVPSVSFIQKPDKQSQKPTVLEVSPTVFQAAPSMTLFPSSPLCIRDFKFPISEF